MGVWEGLGLCLFASLATQLITMARRWTAVPTMAHAICMACLLWLMCLLCLLCLRCLRCMLPDCLGSKKRVH